MTQTFRENRYLIGQVVIVLGSGVRNEIFSDFARFCDAG